MKYKVKVTEIWTKVVDIDADSPKEAKETAQRMWFDGEFGFEALNNLDSHEINITTAD